MRLKVPIYWPAILLFAFAAGCGATGSGADAAMEAITPDASVDTASDSGKGDDDGTGDLSSDSAGLDAVVDVFIPAPPDVPVNPECLNPGALVTLSGHIVQAVAGDAVDLAGGVVSVVGHPEYSVTLGGSWAYELQAPSCTDLVLELSHPGLHTVHTGILYTGDDGISEVTFQTPDHDTYNLLLGFSQVTEDPAACQVATTITAAEHLTDLPCDACGEPGALAFTSPYVTPDHGPIYFQIVEGAGIIYPDPALSATTLDGGVLFVNLPAGDYLLYGWKDGFEMQPARIHCEPGWFVNPAPPRGIQVLP